MFVYIGGIPGVGKTTIKEKVLALSKEEGFHLFDMEERSVLCALAEVSSVEDYRRLPRSVRARARQEMLARFYSLDSVDPQTIRLRDDHFAFPASGGQYFRRPIHPSDKSQMIGIVILTAEPDAISRRRANDLFFRPDHKEDSLQTIAEHQQVEIQTAQVQAAILRVPLRIFDNHDHMLEETVRKVFGFIVEVSR